MTSPHNGTDHGRGPDDYFGLARLLHPLNVATFREENYEKKPLLIRHDDPSYFAELLTLSDVDRALHTSGNDLSDFRVVVDGKETPVAELGAGSTLTAVERIYDRYRAGSSLVLNGIQDRFPALNQLMRALGAEISARININTYLTPAGARGFKPHYDMHDVFIVQVHGTKRWQLFGAPLPLPLRSQPYDRSAPEPTQPVSEFELHAGDVLYLPRGTVHAGTSTDEASLHLTIGIHPILWSNVVAEALQSLFERDVAYREALPFGFLGNPDLERHVEERIAELFAELPRKVSAEDELRRTVKAGVALNPPSLEGHLDDLELLDRIEKDTEVRRRISLQWSLETGAEAVQLHFHGKTVRLPAHVVDEVRFTAERHSGVFTAATIPGELDEPGRLVLVRTLVKEGFLTVC
ncbi:cupin domain-containing protein [Kitasatospora sp. NPDC052868]|uniref:cupin domain-containing protein n=1 Tax=Kitasatospora sp. NPDC052868 TaxID=3364060 RepID=UPI0037C7A492